MPRIRIRSRLYLESCAVADEKMMKPKAPIDVAMDHARRCVSSSQSCPSLSSVSVPVIISQTPIRKIELDSMKTSSDSPKRITPKSPTLEMIGRNSLVVSFEDANVGINPPMINPIPNRQSTLLDIIGVRPIFLIATKGS